MRRADGDPIGYACATLVRLMVGSPGDRTGDVARRAAVDVLSGKLWQHLADEQLSGHLEAMLAELDRRKALKAARRTVQPTLEGRTDAVAGQPPEKIEEQK
jgi:Flp pilus assembly protein TadD